MKDPYAQRPWLNLYPQSARKDIEPRFRDMLSAFRAAVRERPDHAAIRYFDGETSYRALDARSDAVATHLAAAGVARGDRVSLIMQNIPAFADVAVACWKLGAMPVPSNPMYRADELAKVFADCIPKAVICEASVAMIIAEALNRTGQGSTMIWTVSPHDGQSGDDRRVLPAPVSTDFPSLPSRGGKATPVISLAAEDIALLLYTSGTTGVPKGVMIRHDSLAFNAEVMGRWGGVSAGSRILGIAPLFHITGFVSHFAMAIIAQCTLILHYRVEPTLVLETIRRERPTYTVGAITAFNALMNAPGAARSDFVSFDAVYSGGAAIASALTDMLRDRLGIDIRPCYGMTETCSPTHATPLGEAVPVDPGSGVLSIGIPTFSTDAMIADDEGRPVPVGEQGEIYMRGPQIMAGYWNKPDDTREALVNGWMRSGDIGFMDEAGWFYLVDRKKDMINASGFKVWPREVEDCLYAHPLVREAAVVGIPDPYRGETVIAYVSLRDGGQIDAAALRSYCRGRLAAYKVPRHIQVIAELPKTMTGKIQRNVVREMAQGAAVAAP